MQIDNNYQAFLALVKAGLWETEVRLTSYGEKVCRSSYYSSRQSVVGLVSAGLERVVDTKVSKGVGAPVCRADVAVRATEQGHERFRG